LLFGIADHTPLAAGLLRVIWTEAEPETGGDGLRDKPTKVIAVEQLFGLVVDAFDHR
jgi:hypothetical protein